MTRELMMKMIEYHFVLNNKLIEVDLNLNQHFRQSHVVRWKEERDFLMLIYTDEKRVVDLNLK